MLCYVMLMLCYVMLMLCYVDVMLCYVILTEACEREVERKSVCMYVCFAFF